MDSDTRHPRGFSWTWGDTVLALMPVALLMFAVWNAGELPAAQRGRGWAVVSGSLIVGSASGWVAWLAGRGDAGEPGRRRAVAVAVPAGVAGIVLFRVLPDVAHLAIYAGGAGFLAVIMGAYASRVRSQKRRR